MPSAIKYVGLDIIAQAAAHSLAYCWLKVRVNHLRRSGTSLMRMFSGILCGDIAAMPVSARRPGGRHAILSVSESAART